MDIGNIGSIKLTKEQEALIPQYREKWLNIGLATEDNKATKAEIEAILRECYAAKDVETKFPDYVIHTKSPYQNAIMFAFLNEVEKRDGKLTDDNVDECIKRLDSLPPSNIIEKDEAFQNKYGNDIKNSTWQSCYGSHDAHWLAFYDFAQDVLGVDCSKLSGMFKTAENIGWWMPFHEVVIVCPRPTHLTYVTKSGSDSKVVHGTGGLPAIGYDDGFSIYGHNGVVLPEKYGAVPESLLPARFLLEEKNAELRRILMQRIGPERMVAELKAKTLDTYREYTLLEIDEKTVDGQPVSPIPIKMLSMTCHSTAHPHIIRVRPEEKSAREAIKWINHGVDCEEFMVEA